MMHQTQNIKNINDNSKSKLTVLFLRPLQHHLDLEEAAILCTLPARFKFIFGPDLKKNMKEV